VRNVVSYSTKRKIEKEAKADERREEEEEMLKEGKRNGKKSSLIRCRAATMSKAYGSHLNHG